MKSELLLTGVEEPRTITTFKNLDLSRQDSRSLTGAQTQKQLLRMDTDLPSIGTYNVFAGEKPSKARLMIKGLLKNVARDEPDLR